MPVYTGHTCGVRIGRRLEWTNQIDAFPNGGRILYWACTVDISVDPTQPARASPVDEILGLSTNRLAARPWPPMSDLTSAYSAARRHRDRNWIVNHLHATNLPRCVSQARRHRAASPATCHSLIPPSHLSGETTTRGGQRRCRPERCLPVRCRPERLAAMPTPAGRRRTAASDRAPRGYSPRGYRRRCRSLATSAASPLTCRNSGDGYHRLGGNSLGGGTTAASAVLTGSMSRRSESQGSSGSSAEHQPIDVELFKIAKEDFLSAREAARDARDKVAVVSAADGTATRTPCVSRHSTIVPMRPEPRPLGLPPSPPPRPPDPPRPPRARAPPTHPIDDLLSGAAAAAAAAPASHTAAPARRAMAAAAARAAARPRTRRGRRRPPTQSAARGGATRRRWGRGRGGGGAPPQQAQGGPLPPPRRRRPPPPARPRRARRRRPSEGAGPAAVGHPP